MVAAHSRYGEPIDDEEFYIPPSVDTSSGNSYWDAINQAAEQQAYRDSLAQPTQTVAPTFTYGSDFVGPVPGGIAQLPVTQTAPTVTPTYEQLAQQIKDLYGGDKVWTIEGEDISPLFAKRMLQHGFTDPTKFGAITDVTIPGGVRDTYVGDSIQQEAYDPVTRQQLMYGDRPIGYFGSKEVLDYLGDPSEHNVPDAVTWVDTKAGGAHVRAIKDPTTGKTILAPQFVGSSDIGDIRNIGKGILAMVAMAYGVPAAAEMMGGTMAGAGAAGAGMSAGEAAALDLALGGAGGTAGAEATMAGLAGTGASTGIATLAPEALTGWDAAMADIAGPGSGLTPEAFAPVATTPTSLPEGYYTPDPYTVTSPEVTIPDASGGLPNGYYTPDPYTVTSPEVVIPETTVPTTPTIDPTVSTSNPTVSTPDPTVSTTPYTPEYDFPYTGEPSLSSKAFYNVLSLTGSEELAKLASSATSVSGIKTLYDKAKTLFGGGSNDSKGGVGDLAKWLAILAAGYGSYKDAQKPQLQGYTGAIAPHTATRNVTQGKYGPISRVTYAAGGGMMPGGLGSLPPRYLGNSADGMRDSIPAHINGQQAAALSGGEFVIPADVVSHLGNGNSNAGAQQLFAMMDRVRQERTGTTRQGREINPNTIMPR